MLINESQSGYRQSSRWLRAATLLGKYGVTCIPFIQVVLCLAAQPGADERAMLMFFVPPVVASLFLLADNGRFDRTVVRGAWILLTVNSIASLVAEIDVLPIKAQFPGKLPPRIDRVLVLYLASWYSFILVVCPAWYLYWRFVGGGRIRGGVGWKFIIGWLGWALFVSILATGAARKIF